MDEGLSRVEFAERAEEEGLSRVEAGERPREDALSRVEEEGRSRVEAGERPREEALSRVQAGEWADRRRLPAGDRSSERRGISDARDRVERDSGSAANREVWC